MKQTLEEAAKEHQNGFPTCEDDSICAGFINGRRHQCYKSFIAGAKWQSKQSPWISVKDRLPRTGDDLYIVLDVRMNPPGCGVCDFNPKTETWIDYGGNIVRPTHWMPIPPLESNGNELKRKEK